MRKIVAVLLCLVMSLLLFSCNISDDENNTPAPDPETQKAMEMYEQAIKGEICVFDEALGEVKLGACTFPSDNLRFDECEILNKAILDMDGDGVDEYVIQSNAKDHIVLHYYDGTVYSYSFDSSDFYSLNTDGTFYWIDAYETENCTRGLNQIEFDGSRLSIKQIYTIKQLSIYDYLDCEYYMGMEYESQFYRMFNISPGDIVVSSRNYNGAISAEELADIYNIKLISFKISPPIAQNTITSKFDDD